MDDKGILQGQIATFETTLNRAAEDASETAAPIFLNAIKNMSIADGFAILKGGEGAATNFLKEKTTAELVAAFSPIAKNSIDKVELTKYWNPLVSKYNLSTLLTGKPKVNENLDQYVTTKAIDGLFTLMAVEENKIRKDFKVEWNEYLDLIQSGTPLTEEQMSAAMTIIMEGGAAKTELAAFLSALAQRGETVDEITGAAKVLRTIVGGRQRLGEGSDI